MTLSMIFKFIGDRSEERQVEKSNMKICIETFYFAFLTYFNM